MLPFLYRWVLVVRVCFVQETYGSCDIERENISGTGWFTEDPREIEEK